MTYKSFLRLLRISGSVAGSLTGSVQASLPTSFQLLIPSQPRCPEHGLQLNSWCNSTCLQGRAPPRSASAPALLVPADGEQKRGQGWQAPGLSFIWGHAGCSSCSVPSSRHHSGRCRDTKKEIGLVLHAEQFCCCRGVASPNPVMWCFRSLRCSANLHQLLVITALLIHLLILDL